MLKRAILIGGAGCCVLSAPAAAQLWNTGPWDGLDGRPSDRASPPSRPQTRAADDFTLAPGNGQNYAISGLRGRALAKHYTGAFAEIYANAAGLPAASPSFTLASSGIQVLQTGVFGEYDLIDVTINTSGLVLAPGTWWVSIVCDVSGTAPTDGYGFFCTAGNMTVLGSQGYYRVDTGPWLPSVQTFGYQSDFSFTLSGAQQTQACYANCDSSTTVPILNVNDFLCFLNRFSSAESYANCDASTTPPVLNVNDFLCFLNLFSSGCS